MGDLVAVPSAWLPLAERRDMAGIEPIQFALAGMNADINDDPPLAVVSTCEALADYTLHRPGLPADDQKVDELLDGAEQSVRDCSYTPCGTGVDATWLR